MREAANVLERRPHAIPAPVEERRAGRVNEIRIRKYCPTCFAFARRGRPLLGHPGDAGDDRIPFVGSRYSAKSRSRNLPSSRNSAAGPV